MAAPCGRARTKATARSGGSLPESEAPYLTLHPFVRGCVEPRRADRGALDCAVEHLGRASSRVALDFIVHSREARPMSSAPRRVVPASENRQHIARTARDCPAVAHPYLPDSDGATRTVSSGPGV